MQQLTIESRIQLRDEIIKEFKNFNVAHIRRSTIRLRILNLNQKLKEKYNLYIQQFRSESEALFCLEKEDDFSNHICPICKNNICSYYDNIKHKKYGNTCGNYDCKQKKIHTEEAKEKSEKTKSIRYGDKNYNNREKAKITCKEKYNEDNPMKVKEIRNKAQETNYRIYGFKSSAQNPNVKKRQEETNYRIYGFKSSAQNPNVKRKAIETFIQNHGPKNKIEDQNILNILNYFKENNNIDDIYDIYYDNDYFKIFIEKIYDYKENELIQLKEICEIFNRSCSRIKEKIEELKLLDYFNIKDSSLELKFKDFLEFNGLIQYNKIKNIGDFIRKEKSILPKTENKGQPELDFYLPKYNIAFEINDIGSHNNKLKNQFYHVNKTLQCKEKNIRLIHLWEWELTDEDLWRRTSNWILNLLNSSKIQIDIKDCAIEEINQIEAQKFLKEYNLYNYIESDIALGLYCNNELLQVMTFKRQNNNQYKLLQFSTKFGFEIEDEIQNLLNYFIQYYNPFLISVMINLDKFTGKTFEELGFKLIEYENPKLISTSKSNRIYKSIYDCGKNKYIF